MSSRLIKACSLQPGGVLPGWQVTVDHLCAGDLGDDPRELGQVEGRAAELVSPVPSLVLAECRSGGGGIKMIRTLVLAKQAHRELNQLVHPNMVRPLKVGGTVIANRVVFAVLAFVFLYFMSIVTLIFVQLASGLDFLTALSSIIACINNAGPGLGLVGPGSNYGTLSDFQTWVCSAAMLLGRLEVFTLLVLFTPTLWRK